MKNNNNSDQSCELDFDSKLLYDIFSISYDGSVANSNLYRRATNTSDQHVFRRVSTQYRNLSDCLLNDLEALPKDTGTMNLEAGYIAKAYLMALNTSDKNAPNRVMSVNRQALKRIKKMLERMKDRLCARRISENLAWIQLSLDQVQQQRNYALLGTE